MHYWFVWRNEDVEFADWWASAIESVPDPDGPTNSLGTCPKPEFVNKVRWSKWPCAREATQVRLTDETFNALHRWASLIPGFANTRDQRPIRFERDPSDGKDPIP